MNMEANSTQNTNNHAIVCPFHRQGHINPSTKLSLNLALKGVTITFLNFEHVQQEITKASGCQSNNNPFKAVNFGQTPVGDIRYQVVSDGLPVDFDRTGRLMEYLDWYMSGGMYDQLEKAIGKIVLESTPKVNVLIIDTFYPWASKLARKFGLRCASFWTQPAIVFNLYYHVHLLRHYRHFDCLDKRIDPIDYIPGLKSIDPKDLMSFLQDKDPSTKMHKHIFHAFHDVRSVDYVLCNSVQELEHDTISTLQTLIPFYPIGPILLSGPTKTRVPTSLWAESNCSEWLKPKSHGSVLYVSFGSLANFSKNDVMEIAYGLMDSHVDFIWVLRPRTVLDEPNDILPIGFEDEVRGRGIIVPWTDQVTVLSHQATGGFLTHCGWNSVLESIWHEVSMLCFPVFADQITNRKLVVDDWKIGVNLCEGRTIQRAEISAKIKYFMSQKPREVLKENIRETRNLLQSALKADGSSEKYVNKFIEELAK
ncbi:UDP-glycosyltransferase 86A2-like [Silene latifolia]|uniref:UDP-glycosyltransferase 86A2-like n=1 Tax=Silene latifolia TaxID=37657 RepID=UPI003D77066A